uniref:Uncharacterized protein n=1 Tax=Lepisosteus oculatus TaxID=7918 RepID=W5NBG3_LEPOC
MDEGSCELVPGKILNCSICLDILKEPVTLPCGHSFCRDCVQSFWTETEQPGPVSCPQCRQAFSHQPALRTNTILAEVAKRFQKSDIAEGKTPLGASPREVPCDFCTDSAQKAVKSCLMCLASFCETHIQAHHEKTALKKHKLISPIEDFQDQLCSHHERPLELFCREDKTCICVLCAREQHATHCTVTLETERQKKQKQLVEKQAGIQHKLQEKTRNAKELKQVAESLKKISELREIEQIFVQLMSSVNSKQAKVKELIREKCTAFASMTEKILIKLDLEVTDLKKMNTELENLSKTDDNIGFVQSFQSLCDTLEAWEPLSVSVLSGSSFNPVREVLLKLQELAEGIFTAELQNIITAVNMIPMPSLPDPTPTKRADFCKYFYGLTLDIKTASSRLTISELNTKVAYEDNGESKQLFSTNPEKFDSVNQVVCAQGLSAARYYWECEWKGENIGLGVVYKGISRKGTDMSCVLGLNEKSWCLQWDGSCYVALHNGKREVIKAPYCSQIGVYLNSPAGILSFYRLADTPILLHKFKHTFTEPLYPAFHLPKIRSSVKICPVIV